MIAQSLIEGSSWRSVRLFFTTRTWRIFLWNAFISLCRSRFGDRIEVDLFTLYFIRANQFFFRTKATYTKHPWWEVEVLTFQRLVVRGRIGGIKGMSPAARLRRLFPLSSLTQFFFSVSLLCQFFPTVEPCPGLRAKDSGFLKQKNSRNWDYLTYTWGYLTVCPKKFDIFVLISMLDTGSKTETKYNTKSSVSHGRNKNKLFAKIT